MEGSHYLAPGGATNKFGTFENFNSKICRWYPHNRDDPVFRCEVEPLTESEGLKMRLNEVILDFQLELISAIRRQWNQKMKMPWKLRPIMKMICKRLIRIQINQVGFITYEF